MRQLFNVPCIESRMASKTQPRSVAQSARLDQLQLDHVMHRRRSKAYVGLLKSLDSGGRACNQPKVQDLLDAVDAEFSDFDPTIPSLLLGIVSKCYLGHPYEVHTLDVAGCIIEHYEAGKPLPGILERARAMAQNEHYAFIEVYSGYLCAISDSGAPYIVRFDE